MKKLQYKIADHILEIQFLTETEDEKLLPSFRPFLIENHEEAEVTVIVDHNWNIAKHGEEIGQFDVGGNNHGVYKTEDGDYQFEVGDITGKICSIMESSQDFKICHVRVEDGSWYQRNYGLNNCIMMAYAFATAQTDTILMHASVIRKDGYGYLMTAPSGTGKSTHTHLWYTTLPGCDLMNDDNPVVRVIDGKPIIYGSPWSGKTPCYRNIQAPIGGIIRIQQRPENKIRPLVPLEAFTMLLPACSSMKWDARVYNGICDGVTQLIKTCRIWELGCLPNSEAAILCWENVRADKKD